MLSLFEKKWFIGIVLGFFVLVGFVLRVWNVHGQSLWIDEGYTVNASQAIIENGYPRLLSGEIYSNGILENYIVAGFMQVFGFDAFSPWSARLPSVLFGTALIVAVYVLGKKVCASASLALLASGIVTFLTWQIAWSRQVRGYAMLSVFLTIAFIFLLEYLKTGQLKKIAGAVLMLALSYFSHGVALAFIPGFSVVIISKLLTLSFHPFKNKEVSFVVMCVTGVAFIVIPLACFAFSVPVHSRPPYIDFFFNYIALWTYGCVAAIGISFFDTNTRREIMPLIAFIVLSVFIIVVYAPTNQPRYLFPLMPFSVVTLVYGVQRIGTFLHRWLHVTQPPLFTVGVVCILSLSHLTFFPKTEYILERGSPQPDFKGAFSYIASHRKVGDVVVSPYAQLQHIYLGDKGFWVAMNLTGKKGEIERKSETGFDYYVGAPIIKDLAHFKDFVSASHGFAVIDSMAAVRLTGITSYLVDSATVVFDSGVENPNRIRVFSF